jgi:hypothetical protein
MEKAESDYEKVQRAVVRIRRNGRMPYGWIVDSTRWKACLRGGHRAMSRRAAKKGHRCQRRRDLHPPQTRERSCRYIAGRIEIFNI